MEKICRKCNIQKLLGDFPTHKQMKDGHLHRCKDCDKEYKKSYKLKNPDAFKKWQKKNPDYDKNRIITEERKLKIKEYQIANKKKIEEYRKIYEKENREKLLAAGREYYHKNREKRAEYAKNYQTANREKRNYYAKEYQRNKRKTDIVFRIKNSLRCRVKSAIIRGHKSSKTLDLLGCPVEDVKQYLEQQFKSNMSWENYGKYWEIDHIKPCSSFNLLIEEEQKKCFHYTNLQPLTVIENRRKYNKIRLICQTHI